MKKIPTEAIVTGVIAITAVLIATVAFQQHTKDFEATAAEKQIKLENRLNSVEAWGRDTDKLLVKISTQMDRVHLDLDKLTSQMDTVLERIPYQRIER